MAWLYLLVGGVIGALFGYGACGLLTRGKIEDLERSRWRWRRRALQLGWQGGSDDDLDF